MDENQPADAEDEGASDERHPDQVGEGSADETQMSPMELLRHRQAQGDWDELDPDEERKRHEFLAEAELRLSSGRTIKEIEELLRRSKPLE
jgi:hypothetical protein